MTREDSVQLFTEVADLLHSNGFTDGEGTKGKYNYRGSYMLFNCPHMCSSVRLFKVDKDKQVTGLVRDIRTSFAKSLEENRVLATNFINGVIEQLNGEDNAIQE